MKLLLNLLLVLIFVGVTDSWASDDEDVSCIKVSAETRKRSRIIEESEDEKDIPVDDKKENNNNNSTPNSSRNESVVDNVYVRITRLIKERKNAEDIQAEFPDIKTPSLIRYIEKARNRGLLDDELDIAYSKIITKTLRASNIEIYDHLRTYADLVSQKSSLEEIQEAFPDVTRETLYSYANRAKEAGLLDKDATVYLDSRLELAYHTELATLVRQKKTLEELFEFYEEKTSACAHNRNSNASDRTWDALSEAEKKAKLNRVFDRLYQKELLTSDDTLYLKGPVTVIGRNGDTKKCILGFLKQEYRENRIAGNKNELLGRFNFSDFSVKREITYATFVTHIKCRVGNYA